MTEDEVIDSSIDDMVVEETRFHSLVGEVNERSMASGEEDSKKVTVNSSAIGHELWHL